MKILYVNSYFNGGGAELVVRQLFQGIKSKEIQSFCIIGRKQKNLPDCIKVIYNDFIGRAYTTFVGGIFNNTLFRTKRARKKIIELVKKENIDIIHFHNLHSNYIGIEDIEEIRRYCPNIVITLHDMWLLTGGCAYACECKKWKSEGCGGCIGNYSMRPFKLANRVFIKKRNVFANANIHFVTPSEWLCRQFMQSYLRTEKVRVINNGIDLDKFKVYSKEEMRKKYNLPLDKHILLFIANGMNNIYKGFPYLKKALELLNSKEKYALLIVGNKENEIIDLPYDIYAMGYITSQMKINELYAAADIFINPSMADVFPFTVMESLASGTPVLAFRTGGIPEIVNEDVGWLVEAGDYEQLKKGIQNIFEDEMVLASKTKKCRDYIEKYRGLDRTIEEYRRLYFEIMN